MQLPVDDIIEWDVLNWSQLIRYWTPIVERLSKESKVLAIGERNGGLSLWLALLGFDVVCTDIVDTGTTAKDLHKKYGVEHKISYQTFDVVNGNLDADSFDLIVAKSVIGGLKGNRSDASTRSFEVQQKAVDNINRLLKPGGYFLSAENLTGNILLQAARRNTGKTQGWRYLHYRELSQLFQSFDLVQTKTFGILPTFFGSKFVNLIMFFINKHLLAFLPTTTKYIAFTTAQK
ncbi:MAG: class I SAM-dependent methyltransferase [Chitinophagales bacterium]|nr:class I SAM-dependent methyltransferase [Chitinophagaceae bacterium]MCB9065400.1 class I SAM-dependent methyltransferase [Chitinophagales bacterium]